MWFFGPPMGMTTGKAGPSCGEIVIAPRLQNRCFQIATRIRATYRSLLLQTGLFQRATRVQAPCYSLLQMLGQGIGSYGPAMLPRATT
mmetsp:Transcript_41666/g.76281  ORF Transcript_41666/g.76281 Transcript_41666/m.76281 type:complete len:88 (+) Transcript_41666:676-939(+)